MNCNEESVDRLNVKSIFVFKLILLIRNSCGHDFSSLIVQSLIVQSLIVQSLIVQSLIVQSLIYPSKIIVLNSMNHCNRVFIRYVHVFLLLTIP